MLKVVIARRNDAAIYLLRRKILEGKELVRKEDLLGILARKGSLFLTKKKTCIA